MKSHMKTSLLHRSYTWIIALVAFTFAACEKMEPFAPNPKAIGNTEKKSITELLKQSPQHSFLYAAVVKAGLGATLNGAGTFTIFAPTDDAFRAAGFATAKDVSAAPANVLQSILLYHALGSVVTSADAQGLNATPVATLAMKDFYVSGSGGNVWVNNAKVIAADIKATNGVIHVIDKVLMPPTQNLVQLAQSNSNLSSLVAAVVKLGPGVVDLLSNGGPFTVFAPTNDAFSNALAALGFATLGEVPNDALANILTYHVVNGRVFSYNLSNNLSVPTLNPGNNLTIKLTSGAQVQGNGNATASNIIAVNILGTNGVVHVIDQVLLP
jgi:uncharacterized surface protein with fasciclin (FAS1) repeats